MEKLIELLNEYEKENGYSEDSGYEYRYIDEDGISYKPADMDCEVFSIDFNFWKRFIKWLVENDKIDEDKLENERGNDYDHFNRIETLIQMLSIQDNPIEFLISILK